MPVRVICKFTKDLKWWKCIFRCSRAANSVVSDVFWPIQSLMYVLITYKDEKNQMKNEGARVVTTLHSYILDPQVQLTL